MMEQFCLQRAATLLVLFAVFHKGLAEWPSQSFADVVKPVADKCIEKTGINTDIVNNARKGVLPDDPDLKKYLLCVYQTFDLIDKEHHDFEYWKIMTMVPKEMKKPVFEMGKGCTHIKGENYENACLEFVTCLHKADPEKFAFLF